MSDCQFFAFPTAAEAAEMGISATGMVFGCGRPQGDGPLFFFVPVEGGAVRVPVCEEHCGHLKRLYGRKGDGGGGEA